MECPNCHSTDTYQDQNENLHCETCGYDEEKDGRVW